MPHNGRVSERENRRINMGQMQSNFSMQQRSAVLNSMQQRVSSKQK